MTFDNHWLKKHLEKLTPEEQHEFYKMNNMKPVETNESVLETAFRAGMKLRLPENVEWIQKNMLQFHRFDDNRKFEFDFAWLEAKGVSLKIAVEVHGLYSNSGGVGRHLRPLGFTNDREKMNLAQLQGWLVLEITQAHIESGEAYIWLLAAFENAGIKID